MYSIIATIFLFFLNFGYSCRVLKPNDYFDIKLTINTSDCSFAGTDALLLLYLPFHGNQSYTFIPNLGPFQIQTDYNGLEGGETTTQTITWDEIKRSAKEKALCWPSLETVLIEKQRFNWLIPEIASAWKPKSIQITLNGTQTTEILREFPPNCDVGWINDNGFYQIGPAHDQIQMLSNQKEEVFV
uniref:Uncharacterized protein n=1 Tax=Panagrolaimus superbus TaxID=310955 RepID=A0A914YZA4_9BILA